MSQSGPFFSWGRGRAGTLEGRVITEKEHQKGRVIPLCKLFKGRVTQLFHSFFNQDFCDIAFCSHTMAHGCLGGLASFPVPIETPGRTHPRRPEGQLLWLGKSKRARKIRAKKSQEGVEEPLGTRFLTLTSSKRWM